MPALHKNTKWDVTGTTGESPSVENSEKTYTDVLWCIFDAEQHLMPTKPLSFKDKEIQRAEALQDKNPIVFNNSEKK